MADWLQSVIPLASEEGPQRYFWKERMAVGAVLLCRLSQYEDQPNIMIKL